MTITSASMRGESPKEPRSLTREQKRALAVMKSIDSGMTLTRFQIEASSKFEHEVEGEDVAIDEDFFIRSALFALDSVDEEDSQNDKAATLAIAIESLVLAIDQMDKSVEEVLEEALRVL